MLHSRGTPILAPLADKLHAILIHALGMHYAGDRLTTYRCHFVTGSGCDDFKLCRALCELGLMVDNGPQAMMRGDHLFQVNEAGRKVAYDAFPKQPKLSRSQSRYRAWLNADSNMTFGEWLKSRSTMRAAVAEGWE